MDKIKDFFSRGEFILTLFVNIYYIATFAIFVPIALSTDASWQDIEIALFWTWVIINSLSLVSFIICWMLGISFK